MRGPPLGRRALLAAAFTPLVGSPSAEPPVVRLRAAPARVGLVGEGFPPVEVWAYEGTVPGPVLRGRRDGRLVVELENGLPEPTTIHWHGVRGSGARAAEPLLPGGRRREELVLADSGTFWYHPFLRAAEQVGRGLAGLLLVDEPEPYPVDRDVPLVLDDWRLGPGGRNEVAASPQEAAREGQLGNAVTINGRVAERLAVRPGERLRLRLLNAANARIFALRLKGAEPWLVALDGQPVPPQRIEGTFLLAPGQRADWVVDVPPVRLAQLALLDEGDPQGTQRIASLAVLRNEAPPPEKPLGPPPPLPANPLPEPDPGAAEAHALVIEGGLLRAGPPAAAGPSAEGASGGALRRGLAGRGLFWTLGGRALAEPELGGAAPLLRLAAGRDHRLVLLNRTAVFHALHLHGHALRLVARDGRPEPGRPWRDTVLVGPGERLELLLRAQWPGRWAIHSTILDHQAAGLLGVVEVR